MKEQKPGGLKKSKGGRPPIPEGDRKKSFTFRATPENLKYLNSMPAGTRSEFLNLLLDRERNQNEMFKNTELLKQIDAAAKSAGTPIHWGQTIFGTQSSGKPEDFNFKPGDRVICRDKPGEILSISETGIRATVRLDSGEIETPFLINI